LGRRTAAGVPLLAALVTAGLALAFGAFATAPLRAAAFLVDVFATVFFEALFFVFAAVVLATTHLLKLRGGG
jgi:hypothetical protein